MSTLLRKYVGGDKVIWLIIVLLSVASLLSVYSATGFLAYKHQGGNTSYYMFKQLFSLSFGILIMIVVHRIHYKWIARFSLMALYGAIVLLLITLVSGVNLNMASRWLTIPGIGITFQPSELAKLALIVYVAKVLAQHQKEDEPARGAFKPVMIYVGMVAGLIFRENLSTAALVVIVSMAMMFVGRVPLKYLFGTGAAAIALVALLLLLASQVSFLPRAQTWAARVEQYFNPEEADDASSYQVDQSKIAIASSGFFGKGPGNSVQRNFIPHPYSDFIYAIIAEEYGLAGASLILFCYLMLFYRVGVIVYASKRTFPAFLVLGLGLMLVSQAFINMGVAVGIFPVTGQPLPLVSLGTTSVLFTCLAFGIILGVSRQNMLQAAQERAVQGVKTEEQEGS